MPYDMLTREEKNWLRKHITRPLQSAIFKIPNLGKDCPGRHGYRLFDASGDEFIHCLMKSLRSYLGNYPTIKICRYEARSEAGGWYIEYHEATHVVSDEVLDEITGMNGIAPNWDFFVYDIRNFGFFPQYGYVPPGLIVESHDIPTGEWIGRDQRTKYIRAYIVPPDFPIEKYIENKNTYFRALSMQSEAKRMALVESRIGIGDPWANKPSVSEEFCKKCLDLRCELHGVFCKPGAPGTRTVLQMCKANQQPWTLECPSVKYYLGREKR